MRALWIATGVLVALTGPVPAQPFPPARPEYKWCFIELPFQIPHCRYRSIEECRVEIPGVGGYCNLNPRYVEPPPRPAKPSRRHRIVR